MYTKIQKYILQKIKEINQQDKKIDGLNIKVQLNETAYVTEE